MRFWLIVLALSLLPAGQARAGPGGVRPTDRQEVRVQEARLAVVASTADHLLLELTVPEYRLDETLVAGRPGVLLSVPGLGRLSAAGRPSLPQAGLLVGLPPTAAYSLHVVALESELISVPRPIAPAAAAGGELDPPPPAWDDTVYAGDGPYPAEYVQADQVAWLRDLRVLPLSLNPFRYDPRRGELEHVRRLVVRVDWQPAAAGVAPPPGAWDAALRASVVNYDVARAWRGRAASPAPPLNRAASLAGSFKVQVERDGLYQLTYAQLAAAGFPVDSVDPRRLQLEAQGQAVAVWLTGQDDGSFDPGDRLLFYGQASRSRYTRANVYWLREAVTPGLRMAQRTVTPADTWPLLTTHRATLHAEENHLYDSLHPEASGDHWYWTDLGFLQTGCPDAHQSYYFDLPRLSAAPDTATLRASLQGYTSGTHQLHLELNGHSVGDVVWDGTARADCEFDVDAAWLEVAGNELRLENGACPPPPPPSPPPNGTAFNYLKLDYRAILVADGGVLHFQGESGGRQYVLQGLVGGAPSLLDVSEAAAPVWLVGGRYAAGSRLEFEDQPAQARRYLAVAPGALLAPAAIAADTPSQLASPANSADYVLIAHGDFMAAARPLLDLRLAQGLEVLAVDVQDVYDEFSYGLLDPQAMRACLAYAMGQWQRAPSYVLLLGDGTIDYLDHLGQGWHSYVPAYPADVDPYLGETASDNRLAAVVGDDPLPDLHLGRLPVSSALQAGLAVSKLVAYETAPDPSYWNRRLLLVADDDDGAGQFNAHSDELYARLAEPLLGERVYLATDADEPHEYDPRLPAEVEVARAAVRQRLTQGRLYATFMGHSSYSQWAQEILLHRDDVPDLQNQGRLPVVLSLTCYTAAFHYPLYAPLDERLVLQEQGGALAAWGSTGAGISTGHLHLALGFFDAALAPDLATLGAATWAGKVRLFYQSPANRDLVDTYVLLGDPATVARRYSGSVYSVYLPRVPAADRGLAPR